MSPLRAAVFASDNSSSGSGTVTIVVVLALAFFIVRKVRRRRRPSGDARAKAAESKVAETVIKTYKSTRSAVKKRAAEAAEKLRAAQAAKAENASGAPSTPGSGIRVVALGVIGSGKTVFLASMFHALNVQAFGRSYFLEADVAQRVDLGNVFQQISDVGQPWPIGTRIGETRNFTFSCASMREGTKHPIFDIHYLDYAGELLQSSQEAGSTALPDLERHIDEAHALLGMIDGLRILQFLRNEPSGRSYLYSTIQPMIGIMAASTCPIHLVLTKWDLVRDFGEPEDADDEVRLGLVRDALLAHDRIQALVESHATTARRIIRLIPVSAVGRGFAEVDASGRVVKLPNGRLKPTNLEVPLAALLPDLFAQLDSTLESTLEPSSREQFIAGLRSARRLPPAQAVAAATRLLGNRAGESVRKGLSSISGRDGNEVMAMFLDWVARPPPGSANGAQETGGADPGADGTLRREVRNQVFSEFNSTVMSMEERLPSSMLSGT